MSKLKQIFADINGDADVVKQKYFAKKIVENFLLKEGKATVFKVYSIDYIEDQIFFEAIHKKSLNESIRFVEGIEKQINEGFFSAIKDLGKKSWSGVKKVVSKVKDDVKNWWSGPVVGAVKTWNKAVKTAAKTHLGMMVDSQQYSETSYLFEAPWKDAESEGEAAGAENKAAPTQTDPSVAPEKEESSSKVAHKILGLLTPTKKLDAKKSGFASSIDKVRFFRIDGGSLYFGPEAGSTPYKVMTTTATYLEVYMPAEFKGDKYAVGSLQVLITSLMTTDNKGLADFGQHIMGVDMSPAKLTIYDKSEKAFLVIPEKYVRMSGNGMKTIIVGGEESAAIPAADGTTPASDGTTPAADGAKPADAAATPIDNKEAGVEEPTPEEKSEYNKIIDGAVAEAKAKGLPPTFYAGMSTTAEEVWGAFDKFAGNGANDYNPVMILVNSTEYAPSEMNELEYLSYLAAMPTFVNSLIKQPVPSQYEHQAGQYKSFLTAVQGATVSLAKVVNGNMTAKAPATASSAATPATPASAPTGRVEPTTVTGAQADPNAVSAEVVAVATSDMVPGQLSKLSSIPINIKNFDETTTALAARRSKIHEISKAAETEIANLTANKDDLTLGGVDVDAAIAKQTAIIQDAAKAGQALDRTYKALDSVKKSLSTVYTTESIISDKAAVHLLSAGKTGIYADFIDPNSIDKISKIKELHTQMNTLLLNPEANASAIADLKNQLDPLLAQDGIGIMNGIEAGIKAKIESLTTDNGILGLLSRDNEKLQALGTLVNPGAPGKQTANVLKALLTSTNPEARELAKEALKVSLMGSNGEKSTELSMKMLRKALSLHKGI